MSVDRRRLGSAVPEGPMPARPTHLRRLRGMVAGRRARWASWEAPRRLLGTVPAACQAAQDRGRAASRSEAWFGASCPRRAAFSTSTWPRSADAQAILSHTSTHATGTLSMPAAGVTGAVEIYGAHPNRTLLKVSLGGVGEVLEGFDGTHGWSISPMTGPMLLEGRQLDEKRFDSEFHGELRQRRPIRLADHAREGRLRRPALLQDPAGPEDRRRRHRVLRRRDRAQGRQHHHVAKRQMGTVTGTTVESDYKKFGNLLQPTMVKSQVGGLQQVITITAVDYDKVAGLDLRAAGGNQGAAEVRRSRVDACRRAAAADPGGLAARILALRSRAQAPQAVETFDAAWRIVRDSHFDKTLNGVDWDAVAAELRPKAAAARTVGELRAVLRDMLGRLGQSHFTVLPATADSAADVPRDLSGTPGFDVRLVGKDLIVTEVEADGSGAAAGVRTGWKLRSIDGADTTDADRLAVRHARATSAAGRSLAARAPAPARPVGLARRGLVRGRIGRGGAAVGRAPSGIRSAGDRGQPADDVRAGAIAHASRRLPAVPRA